MGGAYPLRAGSGLPAIDTLPDLYARWECWAADVAESHTTYLPLVRFRSPRPLSSWVTALLAVLDSAALFLAISPTSAPVVPARLCLRAGLLCFNRIARAMGNEATPTRAWADFAGWRLNYEQAAYAVAVDAPSALWSGPRRRHVPAIAPLRPARGRPPG